MNTDTAINSNTNKKDEHELSGIKFIQTDNRIISSSYLFLKDKSFGNSYYYQIFEKSEDRPKALQRCLHSIPWQNFSETNRGENELVL